MTGCRQEDSIVRHYSAHPEELPDGRFRLLKGGRVECVLCGRTGWGRAHTDPDEVYPVPVRGHRKLLAYIDDELVVVEGPDTAPPPPRPVPLVLQFHRWQIGCLRPHDWGCSCGLRFVQYATLWRHIGAPRPSGWGRDDGIDHYHVAAMAWPEGSRNDDSRRAAHVAR